MKKKTVISLVILTTLLLILAGCKKESEADKLKVKEFLLEENLSYDYTYEIIDSFPDHDLDWYYILIKSDFFCDTNYQAHFDELIRLENNFNASKYRGVDYRIGIESECNNQKIKAIDGSDPFIMYGDKIIYDIHSPLKKYYDLPFQVELKPKYRVSHIGKVEIRLEDVDLPDNTKINVSLIRDDGVYGFSDSFYIKDNVGQSKEIERLGYGIPVGTYKLTVSVFGNKIHQGDRTRQLLGERLENIVSDQKVTDALGNVHLEYKGYVIVGETKK